jgi:hypothetical protein
MSVYYYQYNTDLKVIGIHRTLEEASKAIGVPRRTIGAAVRKGSLCRFQWYFSRELNFVPWERLKGEKRGKKFTVMVSENVWDRLLVAIGQRKKQDIFRNLLLEWLENEERKHDRESN